MGNVLIAIRRQTGLLLFALGVIAIVVAAGSLAGHATLFSEKRERAAVVGSALSMQQSTVTLRAAALEAERAYVQGALAAREEQAEVYVLPDTSPGPRMVRILDRLVRHLSQSEDGVSLVRVTFDGSPVDRGTYKTLRGTVVLRGSYQTVARLLAVLSLSGDMMVKDVLPATVQETLLTDIEAVAPAALRSTYDFLYLDLLAYAADPSRSEDQMFADIPPDLALDLKAFLIEEGTAPLRAVVDGIAPALQDSGAWPLPLLRVDRVTRRGTEWEVGMTLFMR